jgi:hypothetical protein
MPAAAAKAQIVVYTPPGTIKLADNAQWTNRFEIRSESSNRVYVVSQNKAGRHWGCSCMGWIRYRHCKHLAALGIPANMKPFEALLK